MTSNWPQRCFSLFISGRVPAKGQQVNLRSVDSDDDLCLILLLQRNTIGKLYDIKLASNLPFLFLSSQVPAKGQKVNLRSVDFDDDLCLILLLQRNIIM